MGISLVLNFQVHVERVSVHVALPNAQAVEDFAETVADAVQSAGESGMLADEADVLEDDERPVVALPGASDTPDQTSVDEALQPIREDESGVVLQLPPTSSTAARRRRRTREEIERDNALAQQAREEMYRRDQEIVQAEAMVSQASQADAARDQMIAEVDAEVDKMIEEQPPATAPAPVASPPPQAIAPDAPQLVTLVRSLRVVYENDQNAALEYLTDQVGRKVERVGQLSLDEVLRLTPIVQKMEERVNG